MNLTVRLLGLAFASSDGLAEVDKDGVVRFAMGAGPMARQDAAAVWQNRPFAELLHDPAAYYRLIAGLTPGLRSKPVEVLVNCSEQRVRRATVRAFMLPQLAPAVSLSISYEGPAFAAADLEAPPMLDAEGFLASAGRMLVNGREHGDTPVSLGFLDVHGLAAADAGAAERIARRIQATLQSGSIDGSAAAQLTHERFALIRSSGDTRDLAAEVREAGKAEGVVLDTAATDAAIPVGAEPLCALRAMRFAIEGCLKEGGLANPELAFSESLKRTLRDAETFRTVVKQRDFAVHYQPIVDLGSRAVHHFEALARFNSDVGPANAIRMAEELALIEQFDLVVAEKVVQRLRQPGAGLLKIAVNVSAASLANDAYVASLLRMTNGFPEDRRRLMIEVTETAAMADVEAANRRLAVLREAGVRVCIDDFGAGSATFDYLRRLSVDAVKIDGSLVRDIEKDARARTLIRSLVELCGSMKLSTIAEMIETEAVAAELKAAGVNLGQGWLFGRAEAEPRTTLSSPGVVRRRGTVEAWG